MNELTLVHTPLILKENKFLIEIFSNAVPF